MASKMRVSEPYLNEVLEVNQTVKNVIIIRKTVEWHYGDVKEIM